MSAVSRDAIVALEEYIARLDPLVVDINQALTDLLVLYPAVSAATTGSATTDMQTIIDGGFEDTLSFNDEIRVAIGQLLVKYP